MDRHCSRHSIYQTSAGQEHLDLLPWKALNDFSDEHVRALEPSIWHLSTSELEEYHKRGGCRKQDANDRWHRGTENQRARTSETRPSAFPQAKHRQLYGRSVGHVRSKSRPCPLDLTSGHLWQQQSLGPRRVADQKRRAARTEFDGPKADGEGVMPQTIPPPRIPEPKTHLCSLNCSPKDRSVQQSQRQSKAQEQQSQTPACDQRGCERTNAVSLKAGAKQDAGQWNVTQHSLENQELAQQRREQLTSEHQKLEQQKVQLPTAKPGNLYPGPTRIPDTKPPFRLVHANSMEQSIKSELALSVRKPKIACQEAYCKYRGWEGMEEEERKAYFSIPKREVTRTKSVKQLLASVNKVLEKKLEAAEIEVATTNTAECKAFLDQSPEPSKNPEDTYKASPKRGESFWHKYDRNYPISRQSHGIYCPPSLDHAAAQALIARSDCPVGAKSLARDDGYSKREVPLVSSRTSELQAAVEAIDKTSGELLKSPNAISDQQDSPFLQPSAISVSQNREENAGLSRALYEYLSLKKANRQNMAPPSTPQTEPTDTSSTLGNHEGGHEDAVEAALRGEVEMQSEWEEVDDSLGDEGWINVEPDSENVLETGSLSSSDVEWASDVASEGGFEL